MLITTQNLPMKNGSSIPWGTIILIMVVVAGTGYMGYNLMEANKLDNKNKTN